MLYWKTKDGWRFNVRHFSFSAGDISESTSQPIDLVASNPNAALRKPTQRVAPGLPLQLDALPVHVTWNQRQNKPLGFRRSIDRSEYDRQHRSKTGKKHLLKLRLYLSNGIRVESSVKRCLRKLTNSSGFERLSTLRNHNY